MRFSQNCFEKYINPIAILLCIVIIITLVCLNLIYPHLESIFWPLILVVSIYLSINFMIYYVHMQDKRKAKKRVVPNRYNNSHIINVQCNNIKYTNSIIPLNYRIKKRASLGYENKVYHFGQIENEF